MQQCFLMGWRSKLKARVMKLHWIVDAKRHIPFAEGGFTRKVLKFFDGARDWHPISTAPFNRDLEVCAIERDRSRVVPYPCRQTRDGWINSDLGVGTKIEPTKWRSWPEEPAPCKKFDVNRPRGAARALLILE